MNEHLLSIAQIGRARDGVRVLAVATPLVVALAALASAQTARSVVLSVELPDMPGAGATLFAQKGCSRCHSLVGAKPRTGPDLGQLVFSGSALDLAGAFWNHSPIMREKMRDLRMPPPVVSVGEMTNLVAFLTAYRYYLTKVGEAGDPTRGRLVFSQKGCSACHADGKRSASMPGPDLVRYKGRTSAVFLAQAMWNHGAKMAEAMAGRGVPWPMFKGREMGDLVAYLREGGDGATEDHVYFEPGSPKRGRDLFWSKRCAECHAVAGKGGRGGPDLGDRHSELVRSVPEIAGLMWNHSRGMTAEFERRGIERVTFSGQEMFDIISYLYFVNYANVRGVPARGSSVFVNKCSACHAVGGAARGGPDLATAPNLDEPIAIITAMWNHAADMEERLAKRDLAWPRFEPGEAADVVAYLLTKRRRAAPAGQ